MSCENLISSFLDGVKSGIKTAILVFVVVVATVIVFSVFMKPYIP